MNSKLPKPNTTNSELDEILETLYSVGFEVGRAKVLGNATGTLASDGIWNAKARLEALIASKVEEAATLPKALERAYKVRIDELEQQLKTVEDFAQLMSTLQSREQDNDLLCEVNDD